MFKIIALIVLMTSGLSLQAEEVVKYAALVESDKRLASALVLSDVDKQGKTFENYIGQITIVHFWATWCVPCIKELPELVAFDDRFMDQKLHVQTIAADSHDNVKKYLLAKNIKLNVLVDQYGSSMQDFEVRVLPSSYIINNKGELQLLAQGPVDWASKETEQLISQLISKSFISQP